MKRIKIVEACHELSMGGTERAMQEFALNLDKKKFEVIVAVFNKDGPRRTILEDAGIEVVQVTRPSLRKLIKERKVDILHTHTIDLTDCKGDAKYIQEAVFSEGFVKEADINLFISKALALKASKCRQIEYGKDFLVLYYPQNVQSWDRLRVSEKERRDARTKLGISEDELVIGRIGRAEPSKTDYLLLASAPKIAKQLKNVKFVFVGLPLLHRLCLALKPSMRGRCIFIKETSSDNELARFYQLFDVFWHTASRGETFGNVNAEAMVFGRPVLTHSTPFRGGSAKETMDNAQIEIVDHMKTGIVASYPQDVVEACRLLQDNALRRRLGDAGRQKVLAQYDARVVVKQFERICADLISGREAKVIQPSRKDVETFFSQEYAKRLESTIKKSGWDARLTYRLRKCCYKIIEGAYLAARYILRKLGIDLESLGY